MRKKIPSAVALVVAYNPGSGFRDRCLETLRQFGSVVIIDNGSEQAIGRDVSLLAATSGIHVISNKVNMGLGFALNQGIRYAIEQGYDWVCTLDHDSRLSPNFARVMFDAIEGAKRAQVPLAFLSPVYVDEKSGIRTAYGSRSATVAGCMVADVTITSGNLVPVSTFINAGLFDADLFIDYLDYDFSLRCRRRGLFILEVAEAILLHNLGDSEPRTLLGKTFFVTHHSALRRYYITRNRIVVFARHCSYAPGMTVREATRIGLDFLKVVCFESDKKNKLQAMVDGFVDAVKGGRGPRPAKKEAIS